jgi:hypothetical protein
VRLNHSYIYNPHVLSRSRILNKLNRRQNNAFLMTLPNLTTMSTEEREQFSKAKLAADFEQAAQLRQHQWDEGAPAREYQSRILDKLIKDDSELLALQKKVIDGAAAKAKPSLPIPHLEKKQMINVTGATNFNPTSFHLQFPWQFDWNTVLPETSDPNASSVRADEMGSMSFLLTTVDGEGHSKSCAMAGLACTSPRWIPMFRRR